MKLFIACICAALVFGGLIAVSRQVTRPSTNPGVAFALRTTTPIRISKQASTRTSLAKQSMKPTPIPHHIPTWAYDGGYGADNVPASAILKYVNYAEGSKAVADCHSAKPACKAVMYFNPNFVYDSPSCPNKMLQGSGEDWWLHYAGSSTRRIGNSSTPNRRCGNLQVYAVNPNSPAVQSFFRSYLMGHSDYDLYFLDDVSPHLKSLFAYSGMCHEAGTLYGICQQTEEIKTDEQMADAKAAMVKSMRRADGTPFRFVYNPDPGLDFVNVTRRHALGVVDEGYVISKKVRPENYERELNHMALIDRSNLLLVLLTYGNAANADGSAGQVLMRTVFTAVIWLGFKSGHTVAWENLESGKDKLNVWPEELIYPTIPLQSMADGAKDLEVAPGVWRREFKFCYKEGLPIGQCGAILNSTSESIRLNRDWFKQSYGHSLQLTGGDVISGGTTGFSGPSMDVEAGGAEILLR